MPDIEVDQSGRMEMSGETTVAVSNHFTVTLRVSAAIKQAVRQELLARGVKPNMVMIRMFAGAIMLAVGKRMAQVSRLMIDEEYSGYEAVLKSLLTDRARASGFRLTSENIVIGRIGKQSPAHRAAIKVTQRQANADLTPTVEELLRFC